MNIADLIGWQRSRQQVDVSGVDWGVVEASAGWLAALVAVAVAAVIWRQVRLMRDANAMGVLLQLFERHQHELAPAREYVYHAVRRIPTQQLRERGLEAIDEDRREEVTKLAWFYDHVGALVAHGVVDVEPVSGYMGDTIIRNWQILEPLITAERNKRTASTDRLRWQRYFENLYQLVLHCPPEQARGRQPQWMLTQEVRGRLGYIAAARRKLRDIGRRARYRPLGVPVQRALQRELHALDRHSDPASPRESH